MPASGVLSVGGSAPSVLIAVDSDTPSIDAAVVEPCRQLERASLAILSHRPRPDLVGSQASIHHIASVEDLIDHAPSARVGVTIGAHLGLGSLVHQAMRQLHGTSMVVQHGLLTPHAPPLPQDTTLLAWSDADADYWRCGRTDLQSAVVGSQLLWRAGERHDPSGNSVSDEPPTFLGQLHAAELPTSKLASASIGFCRANRAHYRPHPSEVDKRSRAFHQLMRVAGITLDSTTIPLREQHGSVVAIFSSGLLEAAASGRPAWGYLPRPPRWIEEFWDRYAIARWGGDPTPAPPRSTNAPANLIAEHVAKIVGTAA